MNTKALKISGVVVLLVTFIAGWWFLYYTKTPTYSLGIVRKSVQQHDLDTFKKHVDIDTLMDKAIDDILTSDDQYNEMKNNPFATGLIQMLKPTVVDIVKKKIYSFVETGQDSTQTNSDNQYANGIANNISVENNKNFVGVGKTTKDGKIATVELIVNDEDLGREFTYIINMRELNDGTWQVTGVDNLPEYFKELKKAHLQQLKEYLGSLETTWNSENIKEKIEALGQLNTPEKCRKYVELRDVGNKLIDEIPVPPGAREYYEIRKKKEECNKISATLFAKELEQGQLPQEEVNKANEAIRQEEEYKRKLNIIEKTVENI